MRLKDLFAVPVGQKVTEKHLRRVLISSICSILLCMSCLVSTTWAWFTLSIENTGNEIWIAEPKIDLTVDGVGYVPGTELCGSDIALSMSHANETDDFDKKSTLYVTLTLQSADDTTSVYVTLNEANSYSSIVHIQNETGNACGISWAVSWFAPVNASALIGDSIILEVKKTTEPTTQPTTEASEEPAAEETAETATDPYTEQTTPVTETQPETNPTTEPSSTESTTESTGEVDSA